MNDGKPTNPKDMIGSTKLPYHLVPDTGAVIETLAFLDGALKYGAFNWRVAGVRASIYIDACKRHLDKWWAGEECDPVSGVEHLGHALACIKIIYDAMLANKLTDDRPPKGGYLSLIVTTEDRVAALKESHKDRKPPHHYTIKDTP